MKKQLKIFDSSAGTVEKRPSGLLDSQKNSLLEKYTNILLDSRNIFLPFIKLNENQKKEAKPIIKKDLARVIETKKIPYDMAVAMNRKNRERFFEYDSVSEYFLDILHDLKNDVKKQIEKNIKKWVKMRNLTPKKIKGDSVNYRNQIVTIKSINKELATYKIGSLGLDFEVPFEEID